MRELRDFEFAGNTEERMELADMRLSEIHSDAALPPPYDWYFSGEAGWILNPAYEDFLPAAYGVSRANPRRCVSVMGEEMGQLMSFLAHELISLIPLEKEGRQEEILMLKELFVEVYSAFEISMADTGRIPESSEIRGIIRSYCGDYLDVTIPGRLKAQFEGDGDFALNIIMNADFSDPSYLDAFGEYVDEDVRKTAAYINSLEEDKIRSMADAFTEGFKRGFAVTGRELGRKKSVIIRFVLGFERVVRQVVVNFSRMGLKSLIPPRARYEAVRFALGGAGYSGAALNRQMEADHREDAGLFLDKAFANRCLEAASKAFSQLKEYAGECAGPAVMESFGEAPFMPESVGERVRLTPAQRRLEVKFSSEMGELRNRFVPGNETSFSMISWPVSSIGENFGSIFEETIHINTLDNEKYRRLQELITARLEKGRRVHVKGRDGNRTDIMVSLCDLTDPLKETVFENCTADVNIPVGEVFTSPKLKGTNGVLFVSQVYIRGLRFENLEFTFRDGFVTDYSCTNFADKEENRRYIQDYILFHHDALPLGEFAIGTNTAAYAMAKKYSIFSRLDILIAEKTGPHFALGDTCYSRSEDTPVYNPDGREIIARDNEQTLKRKTDRNFSYYECHTDITIPYEEIRYISSVDDEGREYPVIMDGRFVVEGTEELNIPLEH